MKKLICLLTVLLLLLCGCVNVYLADDEIVFVAKYEEDDDNVFTKNENGNPVSSSGVEYALLAHEGELYYLGELEFVGGVVGEEKSFKHLSISIETGMFAIKNSENDNILIRYSPHDEWFHIYRKTSLPSYDFSLDNCNQLEYLSGTENNKQNLINKPEITQFLAEVREQKSPEEAGLYDLIKKPDGMFENCYECGIIYGYFENEPNLAIKIGVTSFNDLAYSVSIGEEDYVLPESWVQRLGIGK